MPSLCWVTLGDYFKKEWLFSWTYCIVTENPIICGQERKFKGWWEMVWWLMNSHSLNPWLNSLFFFLFKLESGICKLLFWVALMTNSINSKHVNFICSSDPASKEGWWRILLAGLKASRQCWNWSLPLWHWLLLPMDMRFPGGSDGKASACNEGDPGLVPGLGRSPGEGNGNPLQYSCLENSMDGGAWWATVHRVAKSRTRLRDFTFTFMDMGHW